MIYIARALQRDLVRWLLWCVRLRWLSFGRGHFGGFAGWASLRTADWTYHMLERSADAGKSLADSSLSKINFLSRLLT